MADILDYLKQIANSIYGKDVRSSIVNAIRQCYDDGKAGAIDLLARERISNLAKLAEGSTTGDAELADLRVGADGKMYPNAGDAVREQVSELKGNLDKLNEGGLNIKDEVIAEDINNWLNKHPEAITTVEDGSLTETKIHPDFLPLIKNNYVTPETFGAVGDGVNDDTLAIQRAIDSGKSVVFKKGKIYLVDTRRGEPFSSAYEVALRLHNTKLNLNGATIKMKPSSNGMYYMFLIDDSNVEIYGGTIVGDALIQDKPTSELYTNGHLISARSLSTQYSLSNISIHDLYINHAWGDGIIITGSFPCENVEIFSNTLYGCRREGIFVENAKNINIHDNKVSHVYGSSTESGIGIEPFTANDIVENALVCNNIVTDCHVNGIYVLANGEVKTCKNVVVSNNFVDTGNYGLLASVIPNISYDGTQDLNTRDCCDITFKNNVVVRGKKDPIMIYNTDDNGSITFDNNNIIVNNVSDGIIKFYMPTNHGNIIPEKYDKLKNVNIIDTVITGYGKVQSILSKDFKFNSYSNTSIDVKCCVDVNNENNVHGGGVYYELPFLFDTPGKSFNIKLSNQSYYITNAFIKNIYINADAFSSGYIYIGKQFSNDIEITNTSTTAVLRLFPHDNVPIFKNGESITQLNVNPKSTVYIKYNKVTGVNNVIV